MLTPLESGLFDSIAGLPLHPLVVHLAVVLLPLAALGLLLLLVAPKLADRFGTLTLLVLAAGTGAAFVAKESGEALAAKVGEPQTHASLGDLLPWVSVALLVAAALWFVLHRSDRKGGRTRSAGTTVTGLLAAVLAIAATGLTVAVGHSGAVAAWGDVMAVNDQPTVSPTTAPASATATATVTTTAASTAKPSATESATASDSPSADSFTAADVAKHADASSCWTSINGNVYDLTDWIGQHPGGKQRILGLCGKDGTAAFTAEHGNEGRPNNELKAFLIGVLA